jgi:hypothetical protein
MELRHILEILAIDIGYYVRGINMTVKIVSSCITSFIL